MKATRRSVLRTAGASVALFAGASVPTAAADGEWTVVETPTESTLYGVAHTAANAHAVGAGGVVIERGADGWQTVLDGGPTGNGSDLYGADVTDDGERLWFVGASGAIGEYDVTSGVLYDHSAPDDVTNNFNDVAVTGAAGDANVYVAGDSGSIYYSFENGETGTWDSVTPGSGANVNAVDFHGPRAGHAVDGDQTVFVTDDGGTWDRLGIENADYNLYGVDSDATDDVTATGGGGSVYEWDGGEWVREDTGDADLRAVAADGAAALAVGGGGKIYRRDSAGWRPESTPTGENLRDATALGADPEIAVGAGGTVLEY